MRLVRIVLRDVPYNLRNLFKTEFASKYGRQYTDDTASGHFFLTNVNVRKIDRQVKSAIQNGNSADFDCTTLFFCLLYSGTQLLPPMSPRPRLQHLNSSEVTDELRIQRNLLAHSPSTEVSQHDFRTRVNDIQSLYQQLGWSCTDLQQYANNPLDTIECFRLQQELLKEQANNNALDQIVKNHDQRLQAVEGMSEQMCRMCCLYFN